MFSANPSMARLCRLPASGRRAPDQYKEISRCFRPVAVSSEIAAEFRGLLTDSMPIG
jgi:hypothetical protein